ncbi:dihydrofolate reductase family protein [Phreatobacter stygius]|uniref:Dihydrofolate reductase n=1 Tax=Phreatobacter stygius TaxID=1940610 RepID=A0A4D7AUE4_9HYPH|nr:dihydrofolate reductase family protein [Phreatobacter stygius]QCI63261.1 dihydrofolate reductase [Phreatobacter stygius]
MTRLAAPPVPQIVGSMAVSLDGFIAAGDGEVDWLQPLQAVDPGHARFVAGVGTLVMGRATYDRCLARPGGLPYPRHEVIVVSAAPPADPPARVTPWNRDVPALVRHLRQAAASRPAWVVGGPRLQNAFIAAGAIDQLDLFVIPMLAGNGISLGQGLAARTQLDLVSSKVLGAGIVRLRYRPAEAGPTAPAPP